MRRIEFIRSGGQSGADRGALDAAKSLGCQVVGWCPLGGWAEDYPEAPGLLLDYPELRETPSAETSQRTAWNVRDSHATLIIVPPKTSLSPGTDLTVSAARQLGRPYLITSTYNAELAYWLETLGYELTLNVAGPRESEAAGIYQVAYQIVEKVLRV